jgi:hypothetical protein
MVYPRSWSLYEGPEQALDVPIRLPLLAKALEVCEFGTDRGDGHPVGEHPHGQLDACFDVGFEVIAFDRN